MSGFALIHRSLLGHPAFRNDAEAMAFAWMVIKAAWKPCKVRYKGHAITLNRGQLAISTRDFAAAMARDKAWITRLLHRLKSETMIETRAETGVTVITICNYSDYQQVAERGETAGEPRRDAANETDARQRRDTEQRIEQGNKNLPADVRAIMEAGDYVSPPGDLKLLRDWYAAGATLDQDILPCIRRVRPTLSKPPFTLKVFDPHIREKLAADAAEIEHLRRVARRNSDEPQAAAGGR